MNYKEENGTEPILPSEYETWWIDSDVQRKRWMTNTADFLEKASQQLRGLWKPKPVRVLGVFIHITAWGNILDLGPKVNLKPFSP